MQLNNRVVGLRLFLFLLLVPVAGKAEMGRGIVEGPQQGQYQENVYRDWQEGIALKPDTGDYIVTYKDDDFYLQVIYVPSTKIEPYFRSEFHEKKGHNVITYSYRLKNGHRSKQNIADLAFLVTNVSEESLVAPKGWESTLVPTDGNGNARLTWSYRLIVDDEPYSLHGMKPGQTQNGFKFESKALPGIRLVEIKGNGTGATWLESFPQGVVGDRMAEIVKNDFVRRPSAAPYIQVPTPFEAVAVLTSLQRHLNVDIVKTGLVDSVLATQLDRALQAAIEAAKRGNTEALRAQLKDVRQLLKKEHGDVDREDDADYEDDKKGANNRIDKLAARVLDFDIKYILKQLTPSEKDR